MKEIVNAEWAVVGGLLLDNSKLAELDLVGDDFLDAKYRQVFEAVCDLVAAQEVADVITVAEKLERETGRKNWLPILGEIAKNTWSTANISSYAKIVKEEARKRRAVEIANRLRDDVGRGLGAVDEAIRDLMQLNTTRKNYECSISQALTAAVDMMDEAAHTEGKIVGITTGLEDLDNCIGGFQNTDLYVIGARPAMGKTAFLLNCANAANVPAGIISSEQGREQVGLRLIAIDGRVSAHRMRVADLETNEWNKVTRTVSELANKRVWINDQPGPTIEQVIRQARKWKFQHDIKILYLDYIQRIKADASLPRHEQVGAIAMALKELARELEIPVVALAQVNRSVEARPNKRPYMSDLKDSGAIEQEADNIMTLYRDEVYNPESKDKGIVEIAVMKNRHGPTGLIRAVWNAEFMRFEDFEAQRWGSE